MNSLEPTRMRYFTRHLLPGRRAQAEAAYYAHLAALVPPAPPVVLELAQQRGVHGALFQKVRWNPGARVLEFLLRTGDEPSGFFDVLLRYHGARVRFPTLVELERLVQDPVTCAAEQEFDREADSLIHRWLLQPAGEIEIAFADLHVGRLAVANRFFEIPAERFEIVSC